MTKSDTERRRTPPGTRAAYRHFSTITTRWNDNDVYGHVNNVIYYSYLDTAVNEYLVRAGFLDIEHGSVIGLVVESHFRYFSPLAFPDVVHIGLRVPQVGRTSVRYEVGVFRNDAHEASAEGYFVHVYVARASNRPEPLPEPLKAALRALQV
jgi:acyl-CoA thioester hydrolase